MDDEKFMEIALEEAAKNVGEGIFPVGAVIVLNDKVIGKSRKTNSGHLGHAEILAMKSAFEGKEFTKDDQIVLYTTVEPCLMCYGTILHTKIKKIVFALEDPWAGGTHIQAPVLPLRYHPIAPKLVGGVLREKSREIVKKYAQSTDNKFWQNTENSFVKLVLQ